MVAVVLGALAVVGGDDDQTPPDLPVALDGSGATARTTRSRRRRRRARAVTYVPGPDLPALGGEAPAYRLTGSVDEARVRALADALGLEGTVTHEAEVWSVVGDDVLEVQDTGAWWFTSGAAASSPPSSGDVACSDPVDDTTEIDCAAPPDRARPGAIATATRRRPARTGARLRAPLRPPPGSGDRCGGLALQRDRERPGASVDDPAPDEPCPEPAVDELTSTCGIAAPDGRELRSASPRRAASPSTSRRPLARTCLVPR